MAADDHGRPLAKQHEGPIGELRPRHLVNAPAVAPTNDPLAMELPVHLLRRWHLDPDPLSPGRPIRVVALAAAFGTRTMARGE